MKMFGKMTLGFGTVILLMLFVVGTVAYQASSIIGFLELSKKASILVQRWDTVQLGSYDVLASPDPMDQVVALWVSQIKDFEAALEDLAGDRRLPKLGADAMEQLDNTKSLWHLAETNLSSTATALENFKSNVVTRFPILGRSGPDGLQGEYERLDRAGGMDPQAAYYYNAVRSGLKGVTLANQAFKGVLRRLDATIEETVDRAIDVTVFLSVVLIAAALAASFAYTLFFSRRISRRARGIEASMRQVANRDFSRFPPPMGNDEIGMLSRHLREVMESLGTFFSAVKAAASNVTDLKDALSAGTTESAAAINQINKNIESIKNQFAVLDSAIAQSSDALADIGGYLEAFKNDTDAQSAAMTHAGEDLSQAVASFGDLARRLQERASGAESLKRVVVDGGERVQATNEVIKSVSHDISNIVEIIELIDQISEQTNILSMNAAIESAHAGAAGAGFAVVAEEIRKLAESTQDNAQRIGDALGSIASKIKAALESSGNSAAAIDTISADVSDFALDLADIASHAAATSDQSVQVGRAIQDSIDATRKFKDGTAEMYERHRAIRDAMENIKAISDETLSGITEIDAGSKEILESVVHVEEISLRSKERAAELEDSLRGFRTSSECAEGDESTESGPIESDYDERGVAVKRPPQNY